MITNGILKVHHTFWQITEYSTMSGLFPLNFCFHAFDPNELCIKNQPQDYGYSPVFILLQA